MKKIFLIFLLSLLSLTLPAQEIKKEISYDFKVTEDGSVEARKITRIFEGEEVLSTSYYRFNGVIEPGGTLPEELPDNIKQGIRTTWTKEVIEKFKLEKIKKQQKINIKGGE